MERVLFFRNKEIVNGDENFKINLNGDLIIINNSISVNYIQCTKFWYTRFILFEFNCEKTTLFNISYQKNK